MKNTHRRILYLTTTAVMIALICVFTMAVRIPSPTKGYLNLGDCAVLFGAWLLGPVCGTIAGGLGSALADFFAGYAIYVPGTLIIKSLMALILSFVPRLLKKSGTKRLRAAFLSGALLSELCMVAGYYLYEAAVVGLGFAAAFAGVLGNLMQGLVGVLGAYLLAEAFSRTGIAKLYGAAAFVDRPGK